MSAAEQPADAHTGNSSFDAIVVGAGFAGLYMLHRLRKLRLRAVVLEAGAGLGGTWYWNRYPGARCDVQSFDYSYSFSEDLQQDWHWSERYASQPEILAYLEHVAERFDLRRDIRFKTNVTSAVYHNEFTHWLITTEMGEDISARFCIMATGCLSVSNRPNIPGLENFSGAKYFTSRWPHDSVDFSGQRVGIIGTGSSAVQTIPVVAAQAGHLYVFQRTPTFSVPARNAPLDPAAAQSVKANYESRRRKARQHPGGIPIDISTVSALAVSEEERARQYEQQWLEGGITFSSAFNDIVTDQRANETAAEFVRQKILAVVKNPEVAEALTPRSYPIMTKRVCVDSHYYESFNRANVTLVDLRKTPIETLTSAGLKTSDTDYALDAIIFATGFDAMTGALSRIDIRGRGGDSLRQKWAAGPRTYLGLMTAAFPNLFLITGPGSPSVLTNMIVSIEQHVDWIADCISYLYQNHHAGIEATVAAEDAWVDNVNTMAAYTLFPAANSWYLGANVPGKPRVFMPYVGGLPAYGQKCQDVAANANEGFTIISASKAFEMSENSSTA